MNLRRKTKTKSRLCLISVQSVVTSMNQQLMISQCFDKPYSHWTNMFAILSNFIETMFNKQEPTVKKMKTLMSHFIQTSLTNVAHAPWEV